MSNLQYKSTLNAKQMAVVDSEYEDKKKNPVVAWLLWFFLGGLGAHRFYLGNTGYAVCMILFGWATAFIWPLVDAFFINKRLKEINAKVELDIIQRVKTFTE